MDSIRTTTRSTSPQERSTMMPNMAPRNEGAPGAPPPGPSQGNVDLPVQQPGAPGPMANTGAQPPSPASPVPQSFPAGGPTYQGDA